MCGQRADDICQTCTMKPFAIYGSISVSSAHHLHVVCTRFQPQKYFQLNSRARALLKTRKHCSRMRTDHAVTRMNSDWVALMPIVNKMTDRRPWKHYSPLRSVIVWSFVADTVYVVCFSLILLSVDLTSPHIKNKMSKREFIRNTRRAAEGVNDDFAGHLYDNIYLRGHIAPQAWPWAPWPSFKK